MVTSGVLGLREGSASEGSRCWWGAGIYLDLLLKEVDFVLLLNQLLLLLSDLAEGKRRQRECGH